MPEVSLDEIELIALPKEKVGPVGNEVSPDEIVSQGQPLVPQQQDTAVREGPLGIIPSDFRSFVKESIDRPSGSIDLPRPVRQFALQSSLPIAGATAGGALGLATGPLAPLAVPVLAGAGAAGGEILSQELGISPESRLNLILSGLGPFLAPAARLVKGGSGILSSLAQKAPPFKKAAARAALDEFTKQSGSIGTRILSVQKGLMARESKVLFRAARIKKSPLTSTDFRRTQSALKALENEADGFKSIPEGRQILRSIKAVRDDLGLAVKRDPKTGRMLPRKPVDTETLGRVRQLLGASIGRLESEAGVKLGSAKKTFSAMSDDLDNIAVAPGLKGEAAMLRRAAGQRAKLEFAVKDLEEIVSKSKSTIKGEGTDIVINGKQVLDNINKLIDPKSPKFDKNFATALKDELPEIIDFFGKVNNLSSATGSAGGPGSLVYRGLTAGFGATVGGVVGGGPGGVAGAVLGAQAPELITAALLSPTGRKVMLRAAQAGQGSINDLHWAILGEFLAQAAPKRQEQ